MSLEKTPSLADAINAWAERKEKLESTEEELQKARRQEVDAANRKTEALKQERAAWKVLEELRALTPGMERPRPSPYPERTES